MDMTPKEREEAYEKFRLELSEDRAAMEAQLRKYEAPAEAELEGVEMDLLSPCRSPAMEEILELYNSKAESFEGHTTGWYALDKIWRIAEGELVVVTGVPGHGKSTFAEALAVNMSVSHDWGWVTFSPENWNAAWHFAKILTGYIGKPFMQGKNERMSRDEMLSAMSWAQRHFTFIRPSEKGSRLDQILNAARFCIFHYGNKFWEHYKPIKGVIIDPWSQIEAVKRGNESEHEYIGKSLTSMVNFARKNKVAVIIVAHPRKLETTGTKIRIPHPYDISGSAHWFNTPDVCLTVYREDGGNTTKIKTWKVKLSERGQVGECTLYFNGLSKRFSGSDGVWQLPERLVTCGNNGKSGACGGEGEGETIDFARRAAGERASDFDEPVPESDSHDSGNNTTQVVNEPEPAATVPDDGDVPF